MPPDSSAHPLTRQLLHRKIEFCHQIGLYWSPEGYEERRQKDEGSRFYIPGVCVCQRVHTRVYRGQWSISGAVSQEQPIFLRQGFSPPSALQFGQRAGSFNVHLTQAKVF